MKSVTLAIALLISAIATETSAAEEFLTTKDLVECRDQEERDICYLSLYIGTANPASLSADQDLLSNPELMDRIAAKYPERLRGRSQDDRDKRFYELTSAPLDQAQLALQEALELDGQGLSFELSLAPVRDLAKGLESRSFYAGQITTKSGPELRIGAARSIFEIYADKELRRSVFAVTQIPKLGRLAKFTPSRELAAGALAIWEHELQGGVETNTYFSADKSYQALAMAYGALGDKEALSRLLPPSSDISLLFSALWLGDLETAWELTKTNISKGQNTGLLEIPRYADAFGDDALLEKIGADLMRPEFNKHLSTFSLRMMLGYFDEPTRRRLEDVLLTREDFNDASRASLWLRRGELDKYEALMRSLEQDIANCTDYNKCPFRAYINILARQNNAIQAKSVLTGEFAERFLDTIPFYPYQAEMSGDQLPSTLPWMLERMSESSPGSALQNLIDCVEKRIKTNTSVAETCLDLAVDFSGTQPSLEFESSRIAGDIISFFGSSSWGRYRLAYKLFEFAEKTQKSAPELSVKFEEQALDLLSEVPAIRLSSTYMLKQIALHRVESE